MDKNKIKNFALNLLFPKFCLGCGREGFYICQDCWHLLEISDHDYCLCESNETIMLAGPKIGKCHKCQNKKLSGLYFALSYKDKPLTKKLIRSFKYKPYLKDLAKDLAAILLEHFVLVGSNKNEIWENSVLIPVPLDAKKIKKRDYNQSEELAKELSKILQIPVYADVLIKTKIIPPQAESTKEERIKNVIGAFDARQENKNVIKNKKIFLVDDVYTTGSTMQECAKILLENKASQVWGITIARESYN